MKNLSINMLLRKMSTLRAISRDTDVHGLIIILITLME